MTQPGKSSFPTVPFRAALALLAALAGCGGDGRDPAKDAVISQYVKLVRAGYDDSIAEAKTLREAITELMTEPSQKTLDAARKAWVAARPAYLQTEAFRFYQGPIDDARNGREGRINAWPLDEAFIDYVRGPAGGAAIRLGIINDRQTFPDLSKEVLIAENGAAGAADIVTGYHAIEFLLWGEDTSDTGPGNRPFSDFVAGQGAPDPDADRRRQYLKLVVELLVEDLTYVREQWNEGAPYLRAFLANADDGSLQKIIRGITALTKNELADKRIRPASETQAQEPEHEPSRFSDTSDQDLTFDLLGIENVYLGRYGDDDGKGLDELVRVADSELDAQIKTQLEAATAALTAIPKPFDQAIKNEPRKLREALRALEDLNGSLAQIPEALKR
jgi:putative iron-regulated protein